MKKRIILFFSLVLAFTALLLPLNAFAESHIVKINGTDRLEITNVIESIEGLPEEGFETQGEFVCGSGAKLITLEDNTITLVFHTVHDPENGSTSSVIAPDNYAEKDLNENGEFLGLPKGGSYSFTEKGMYYYHVLFEDNTMACGYVTVNDNHIADNSGAVSTVSPVVSDIPEPVAVVSKAQTLQIEEEWTDVDAYNIYGNNYIKLRDFAHYYSLFGTHIDKYFDVTWDAEKNAINLVTGNPYTEVGGEGSLNAGIEAQATLSSSSVYLNGEYIPLTAYNINGNNYFKLRDVCEALNISISWWPTQQIIYINNDYPYGTEFEEIVPDAY